MNDNLEMAGLWLRSRAVLLSLIFAVSACAAQRNQVSDPLNVELCLDRPHVAYHSLGRVQSVSADQSLSALDNFRRAIGSVKDQTFRMGGNAVLLDADVGAHWDMYVISNVIYEARDANPTTTQTVGGEAIVLDRLTQGGFATGCVIGSARGPN